MFYSALLGLRMLRGAKPNTGKVLGLADLWELHPNLHTLDKESPQACFNHTTSKAFNAVTEGYELRKGSNNWVEAMSLLCCRYFRLEDFVLK
jgi:hypothetical protein